MNLKKYQIEDTTLKERELESISRQFIEKANKAISERHKNIKQPKNESDVKQTIESIPMNADRLSDIRKKLTSMFEARAYAARLGDHDFDAAVLLPAEPIVVGKIKEKEKFKDVIANIKERYDNSPKHTKCDVHSRSHRTDQINDLSVKYSTSVAAVAGLFARKKSPGPKVGKLHDKYGDAIATVEKALGGGPKV